jgi:hypothetical protein
LFAFDLLELDGRNLRREPIEARKAALAKLLRNIESGIVYAEHTQGDAAEIFAHACRLGYEGHRLQAGVIALRVRPVDRLGKTEEPRQRSRSTGGD